MVRVVPYAAIQFAAFDQYKHFFEVDQNGFVIFVLFIQLHVLIVFYRTRTPFRRLVVGSLAATTATIMTYPLDTAKARLSVSTKEEYKSLSSVSISSFFFCVCFSLKFKVFSKTYGEGGLRLLYRGLYPTILGK